MEWLLRSLEQWPGGLTAARAAEYARLASLLEPLLADGSAAWRQLPGVVQEVFGYRGWAWNGIYVRHGDQLDLSAGSAGPPVCATLLLDASRAVGSSGSCWDAILMNQVIALDDVTQWPGYVSCDGASRLRTVSGLVCPIRGADLRPVAVWDLDATEKLAPEDPLFMGRLFDTLSVTLRPATADFA